MIDFVGEYARLYAHALKLTRNPADARDLVHDTILRALERGDSVEKPRGYLHVMMTRLWYGVIRRRAIARDAIDALAAWGEQWGKDERKAERSRVGMINAHARGCFPKRPRRFASEAEAMRARREAVYADPVAREAYRARNREYSRRYRQKAGA